jgi:hypothetical protein
MDGRRSPAGAEDCGPFPVGSHSVNGDRVIVIETDFHVVCPQIVGGPKRIGRFIQNRDLALRRVEDEGCPRYFHRCDPKQPFRKESEVRMIPIGKQKSARRFKDRSSGFKSVREFRLTNPEKQNYCRAIPPRSGGAFRPIVTIRGARDAMDALATRAIIRADERRRCGREGVWSWLPDAEAKLAGVTNAAGDGGKKARSPGRARYKR